MGTAERHEAAADGGVAQVTAARRAPKARDHDIPRADGGVDGGHGHAMTPATSQDGQAVRTGTGRPAAPREPRDQQACKPLWVEEPARRRRLPDPVREAAVRAVLIIAVTLIQAVVAFLCTMAGSWLAFPMVLSSVASTVVATWAALDVWVTRQVWSQRHGVVSSPSSTARALRRERRRTLREERAAERAHERIRRSGGAGQLSHP
ncbi:hypothetical protein [Streptomyces sp. NPDC046197]|uniref:hypothetical protein n=1 Tax=Streptomyces sp. NPDC046197 TaxID=3154337 RepID=UPI0033E6DC99